MTNTTDTNTTAIVPVRRPQPLTPAEWNMIQAVAPAMHMSRLFGFSNPHAAEAVMLKGRELGFELAASVELIRTVEGRPTLTPRGMLALLHTRKDVIAEIEITQLVDDKSGQHIGHECTIRRVDGFEYTGRFTLADAQQAGLIKPKSGWEKYPERMTLWRAVDFAADVAAPDVTNGMNTYAKFDDDVIDADWLDAPVVVDVAEIPQDTGPDETTDAALAAQTLIDEYGALAVLNANDGKIPTMMEEIDALRYKLIAGDNGDEESE